MLLAILRAAFVACILLAGPSTSSAQSNAVTPGRLGDGVTEGELTVNDTGVFFSLVRHIPGASTRRVSLTVEVCNPAGNDPVFLNIGAKSRTDVRTATPGGMRDPRIDADRCRSFAGIGAHSAALITASGLSASNVRVTSMYVLTP